MSAKWLILLSSLTTDLFDQSWNFNHVWTQWHLYMIILTIHVYGCRVLNCRKASNFCSSILEVRYYGFCTSNRTFCCKNSFRIKLLCTHFFLHFSVKLLLTVFDLTFKFYHYVSVLCLDKNTLSCNNIRKTFNISDCKLQSSCLFNSTLPVIH